MVFPTEVFAMASLLFGYWLIGFAVATCAVSGKANDDIEAFEFSLVMFLWPLFAFILALGGFGWIAYQSSRWLRGLTAKRK